MPSGDDKVVVDIYRKDTRKVAQDCPPCSSDNTIPAWQMAAGCALTAFALIGAAAVLLVVCALLAGK